MSQERAPFSSLSFPVGPLGIIAMDSCKEIAKKVDAWLLEERHGETGNKDGLSSFFINSRCPRFSNGEAKAIIDESVRGKDIFILCDVGNYSLTYNFMGNTNHMSPDDHFADLKRIISAIAGKAKRINVIMPFLYGGRQHKRVVRESLDCAEALRELAEVGVSNIITFDAHDSRVSNAIPEIGFEDVHAYYQFIKALYNNVENFSIDKSRLMMVSPDEGGIHRNLYYSSLFGIDLGVFIKRRDYSRIVNGRNPIVAHEFIGDDVEGKDILIIDDMLSSGDSMIDIIRELKSRKAGRIFAAVTYALFTDGIGEFQKCYEEGLIDKLLATNLTYRRPELKDAPWFVEVDMSKYIAKLIDALNYDESLGGLVNPAQRILNYVHLKTNDGKK